MGTTESEIRYFNFPVELLKGFLNDTKSCLDNILYYSVFFHSRKLENGTDWEKFKESGDYLGVDTSNWNKNRSPYGRAFDLHYKTDSNAPKTGLNTNVFWDFYEGKKSEFEKVCLLAYLAFKSMLINAKYCKTNNLFLWSRMDGISKTVKDISELSEPILKYANEYQTKRIKDYLQDHWYFNHYGGGSIHPITGKKFRIRGYYISFEIGLDELIYMALKNESKNSRAQRQENRKNKLQEALLLANERLAFEARTKHEQSTNKDEQARTKTLTEGEQIHLTFKNIITNKHEQ